MSHRPWPASWDRQGQTDQQWNCSAGTTSTTSQGPPSNGLPSGERAVTPSITPWRAVCGRFWGSAGKRSRYACGHGSSHPAPRAGGCPWGWWISATLTTAYIPTLRFSTPNADWPSSVRGTAMRTGPPPLISIGFSSLLSLIVESKPKSQLFKFYIDVMNTWQHK